MDLENARSHSLRGVLLAIDEGLLPRRKWPSSFQILKAHDCSFSVCLLVTNTLFSREKGWEKAKKQAKTLFYCTV